MTPKEYRQSHNVARDAALEGRVQARGLLTLLQRRPVISAVLIVAASIAIEVAVGVAATANVPPIPKLPDFIALCAGVILIVALVTVLGWWRMVGYNRPAEWHNLILLLLPILLLFLPLLDGFKPVDTGTVLFLMVGYLLTGFYEETLFRGVLLRLLLSKGAWPAVLVSSLLFALAHSTNLFLRFSGQPLVVVFQMLGTFTFGIGFAALRLRTNTIWPLIILHAAMDLFLALGQLPTLLISPIQDTILLIYGIFLLRSVRPEEPWINTDSSLAQQMSIASASEEDAGSQEQPAGH